LLPKAKLNEVMQRYVFTPHFQQCIFQHVFIEGTKRKAMSQVVEGVPEGEQRPLHPPAQIPPMPANEDGLCAPGITQDKFLLHPNDPRNFLKLCAAIRILLRREFTGSDIDQAERLIREYCTELISVHPCIAPINMPGGLISK